ncbi:MAG: hypothetical protein KGJ06_01860 [Pseudomonadota bacterium]|nr:hypothetical protein [Pseudomonadota bacterium]
MTQGIGFGDEGKPVRKPLSSGRLRRRSDRQTGLAWLDEPYNHAKGEMALWVAVITQAMMDALSQAKTAEASYQKHEAICWLTSNSKDFAMVCLCAGLDPAYVRRKAKKALAAPVPWRAEAGKGKRYLERKAYRRRIKEAVRQTLNPDNVAKVVPGPWARACSEQ